MRATANVPGGAGPWPLTGRHSELDLLRAALTGRRPRSAVLVGAAGAGKTRLAREAQALAESSGRATQWVTATHTSARTPLGAFAPLLPATEGSAGADTLQDLLRRSAQALVSRAKGRPFVLFVDDAHLLDEASAGLLQQLVATATMLVVLTVRSGEPVPEALTALWKDDLAVRVEVARLDNAAVGQLLAAALDGQVDPAAVVDLGTRSGGNVLFLRELVLGAISDGSLARDMDVWRLCGPLAPSERIVELVAARLHGLDDESMELLQLVAYAEPLGTRELRSAAPATVERLERTGLLVSEFDGRRVQVRLVHPLYVDVLRRSTSALRRAAMGRTLADAAEASGGRRRDDPLRIGIWRMDGGGGGRPEILLRAAEIARWHYDFGLAERLAHAAVDAGAGFAARLLSAQTAALSGRPAEAAEQMVRLRDQASTDAERASLAVAHIDCLWSYLGRPADGLRVAEQAEREITDPHLKAEVASRRTGLLLIREGPGPAALSALSMLRDADPRTASWLLLVAAYGLGRLGRFAEAQEAAGRGFDAATQGEPGDWYPWFYLFTRCESLVHAGAFGEARELARAQYEQGLTDASSEARAYFLWNLARPVRECGHALTAAAQAREAITLLRRLGRVGFEHSLLSTLAIALALSGDYQEANLALVAAHSLQVEQPQWSATDHLAAQAWTSVAEGRLATARTTLMEAADTGERIGDLVGASAALHDVARLGSPARSRSG